MEQTLDQIKEKAKAFQDDLRNALAAMDVPDISTELDAISAKFGQAQQALMKKLESIGFPELMDHIHGLEQHAADDLKGIKKAIADLGYPNLVDDLLKTKEKMAAYRAESYQGLNDLQQIVTAHASEYAARRKAELAKRLQEIDSK